MKSPLPDTTTERRRRRPSTARRQILDATGALLLERGVEAVSIRNVSERCGFSAPTIYHHFGDKTGLIDALLEEHFRLLYERVRTVPGRADPVDTLRAQFDAFLEFGLENPTHYQLLDALRPNGSEPPESAEKARLLIEGPLRALSAAGRLETDDIELAVQCIWVMLHGLVSLQISRPDHDWSPSLGAFSLDTLIRGLVRPARPHGQARAPERSDP